MVLQELGRFKATLQTGRQNESSETYITDIFPSDEIRARDYLITMSQNELSSGTISSLLKGSNLEKGDKLMLFTLLLDEDGLLRVGGRLNKAPQTYNAKHLIFLHSCNKTTRRLIETTRLWPSGRETCEGSPAREFPDDWIEKIVEKS